MKKPIWGHGKKTQHSLFRKLQLYYSLFRSRMKKQSGFTLIELMVVMAIIAILATAGLSAYSSYIKKARDTTRLSIASQVETAVNALMGSNGGITPTDSELITYLGTLNLTAAIDALQPKENIYVSSLESTLKSLLSTPLAYAGIKDPVGGRSVCVGYSGSTVVKNQPCQFHYIVYGDDAYVIAYGVESESSMKSNFYYVLAEVEGTNTNVYVQAQGSASYVGLPAITTAPGSSFSGSKATHSSPSTGSGISNTKSGNLSTAVQAPSGSNPPPPPPPPGT